MAKDGSLEFQEGHGKGPEAMPNSGAWLRVPERQNELIISEPTITATTGRGGCQLQDWALRTMGGRGGSAGGPGDLTRDPELRVPSKSGRSLQQGLPAPGPEGRGQRQGRGQNMGCGHGPGAGQKCDVTPSDSASAERGRGRARFRGREAVP